MATTLTYQQLYDQIKAAGGFNVAGAGPITVSINGTITLDLTPYQEQVLKLDFKEFTDTALTTTVSQHATTPSLDELFSIDKRKTNIYEPSRDGGSILYNADRIIINAKSDYAMLFGKQGVAIASPERVNIDSGDSITLFGHKNVFLGLPNKGREAPKTLTQKDLGNTKGDPTPDFLYEPLVLGVKLANLLEDIIYAVQNADLASGISEAKWQPSAVAELELIKNRIPEMLSTFGYVDGISHEQIDIERTKKLQRAQAKAKPFVPPKNLLASVVATIDPPVDGLGTGPSSGPIGTAQVVDGGGGGKVDALDQSFAAKYNGGVLPVQLYTDGTIPIVKGGPPPTRAWYKVNASYDASLTKVSYPYSKDGVTIKTSTMRAHPDFAAKLGPAFAEITQNGGGVYIHDLGGGIYARNVTNGFRLSHHAWALALDINTGGGPYKGALAGTGPEDWGWGTKWNLQDRTVTIGGVVKPWTSAHQGFYDKVVQPMWKQGIGWYYAKDSMHFSIWEGTATGPQ